MNSLWLQTLLKITIENLNVLLWCQWELGHFFTIPKNGLKKTSGNINRYFQVTDKEYDKHRGILISRMENSIGNCSKGFKITTLDIFFFMLIINIYNYNN